MTIKDVSQKRLEFLDKILDSNETTFAAKKTSISIYTYKIYYNWT